MCFLTEDGKRKTEDGRRTTEDGPISLFTPAPLSRADGCLESWLRRYVVELCVSYNMKNVLSQALKIINRRILLTEPRERQAANSKFDTEDTPRCRGCPHA